MIQLSPYPAGNAGQRQEDDRDEYNRIQCASPSMCAFYAGGNAGGNLDYCDPCRTADAALQKGVSVARAATCRNNHLQSGIGISMYADDNGGYYPYGNGPFWNILVEPYISQNCGIYYCPVDTRTPDTYLSLNRHYISLGYNFYTLGITPVGGTPWSIRTTQVQHPVWLIVLADCARGDGTGGYYVVTPHDTQFMPADRHSAYTYLTLLADGHAETMPYDVIFKRSGTPKSDMNNWTHWGKAPYKP